MSSTSATDGLGQHATLRVILISAAHAHDTRLRKVLQPLIGAISVAHMREANLMVDRDTGKRSVADAARFLAKAAGLSKQ